MEAYLSPVSGTVVDTKLNHYGSGNYIIIDTDYHWTGPGRTEYALPLPT